MNQRRLTNKEIKEEAARLGFKRCPGNSHGELIFRKGQQYITYDRDSHCGGFWKVANSPKNLRTKSSRSHTADKNLKKIAS